MNPAQMDMCQKMPTLLSSPGCGGETSPAVEEKASASSITTDMEVESQPSIKFRAGQTSLGFDSSIETVEIESDESDPLSLNKRNRTTSSANYDLPYPDLSLASLQTILSVPEVDITSPQGSLPCQVEFVQGLNWFRCFNWFNFLI